MVMKVVTAARVSLTTSNIILFTAALRIFQLPSFKMAPNRNKTSLTFRNTSQTLFGLFVINHLNHREMKVATDRHGLSTLKLRFSFEVKIHAFPPLMR